MGFVPAMSPSSKSQFCQEKKKRKFTKFFLFEFSGMVYDEEVDVLEDFKSFW